MNSKILNGFNLLLSIVSTVVSMLIAFSFDTTLKIKLFSGVVLILAFIIYLVEVNNNES